MKDLIDKKGDMSGKVKMCKGCKKKMPTVVIINTTPLTLAQYFSWQESDKSLCPKCFEEDK